MFMGCHVCNMHIYFRFYQLLEYMCIIGPINNYKVCTAANNNTVESGKTGSPWYL